MDKLKTFDKRNCELARAVINKHLMAAGAELGLTIEIKNISFTDLEFSTRLVASIGDGTERFRQDLKDFGPHVGLPADLAGKTLQMGGNQYEIVGYDSRCRGKFNVVTRKNGSSVLTFVSHLDVIKRLPKTATVN